MSWYREYRPTSIAGLHLASVRAQLEQLLKAKTFPHALLVVGPRGSGKTSTARIIAAILNDPTQTVGTALHDVKLGNDVVDRILRGSSMAVHELDAASHRGIDDVRALKEQAYLPAQEGSTLVFILDEVHMLTTEAFNALLKLLEEPPSNVVFILATTEEHKVPDTIISRCTVVRFARASTDELKAALAPIVKDQKLKIDDQALEQIASSADGSFRDAVKLLETVAANGDTITTEHVLAALGGVSPQTLAECLDLIITKDEKKVVEFFARLRSTGADQDAFYRSLLRFLHQDIVAVVTGLGVAKYTQRVSYFLLSQFASIEGSHTSSLPFLQIELKSLDMIFKAQDKKAAPPTPPTPAAPRSSSSSSAPQRTPQVPFSATSVVTAVEHMQVAPEVIPDQVTISVTRSTSDKSEKTPVLVERWIEFARAVEARNSSLAAVLLSAKSAYIEPGVVQINVFYQFHRDQLCQAKFAMMIEQVAEEFLGESVRFEVKVAESSRAGETISNISMPIDPQDQLVQLAQEVFL